MSTPMHLGWNRNHHLCHRFWRLLVSRHGHLRCRNQHVAAIGAWNNWKHEHQQSSEKWELPDWKGTRGQLQQLWSCPKSCDQHISDDNRWHISVPLNLGTLTGASCSFYDSMFENLKTLAKHNIWGQARLAKLEPGFPPQRPEMKWRPSPVALRGENNLTTRRKPGENCGHDRRSAMGWVLGWVLSGRSASGTWWNPIVQLQ